MSYQANDRSPSVHLSGWVETVGCKVYWDHTVTLILFLLVRSPENWPSRLADS